MAIQMNSLEKGRLYSKASLAGSVKDGLFGQSETFYVLSDQLWHDGWVLEDGELFLLAGTASGRRYEHNPEEGAYKHVLLFARSREVADSYRYLGSAAPEGFKSSLEVRTLAGSVVTSSGFAYRLSLESRFHLDLLKDDWFPASTASLTSDLLVRLLRLVTPITPSGGAIVSGTMWFSGSESRELFGEQLWQSLETTVLLPRNLFPADDENSVSAFITFASGKTYSLPLDITVDGEHIAVTFDEFFDLLDPNFEPPMDRHGRVLPFESIFSVV